MFLFNLISLFHFIILFCSGSQGW